MRGGPFSVHRREFELAKDYQGQNREYFNWCYKGDGASQIARALFEQATDIVFYVGCAVNPAHQNEEFGFGFKMKMQIVDSLAAELKKMGKKVTVQYF